MSDDKRPEVIRPVPPSKLTEAEREHILAACNQDEYA
jgi:hypothetical protein